MKKLSLIGKKFHHLTVVDSAPGIPSKSRGSDTAWKCLCACGKILTLRTSTLTSGSQKSCGCVVHQHGKLINPGDKFNQLTAVSYQDGKWICLCECGKSTKPILTSVLFSGKRKSCGCIKGDVIRKNQKLSLRVNTKYEPRIASARRRWKSYLYQDKQCDLTFEQWMEISQRNCYYCGVEPDNQYNYFSKKKDASENGKLNGNFRYNGLDRVSSDGYHTLNNVVACCYVCNRAKSNRSPQYFYQYIEDLKKEINVITIQTNQLPSGHILTSIKDAYRHYKKNFGEMGITLEEFYTYSQLPCTYCGKEKVNCLNTYLNDKKSSQKAKREAYFYYNGIDRVDSEMEHTKDNVVTCCKYCNFGKGKLPLHQWQEWIDRIKKFQSSLS